MNKHLNKLLDYCIINKYTDIHFSIIEDNIKVEFRVNNQMYEYDKYVNRKIFDYLAYLSNLDLTNYNTPQSGKFIFKFNDTNIDCRFSMINSINYRNGVLRILYDCNSYDLNSIDSKNKKLIDNIINKKSGLVLFSGPTGSGKTTTINMILNEIYNRYHSKIITIEDPIEITNSNFIQLQINNKTNFTYSEAIKSILRHDPNVIMIGEIRDIDTIKYVIEASLTGHLVLSTIHAKNTLEVILRLKNYGISDYMISDCLEYVVSQRLVNTKKGIDCIYEIIDKQHIEYIIKNNKYKEKHKSIEEKIKNK